LANGIEDHRMSDYQLNSEDRKAAFAITPRRLTRQRLWTCVLLAVVVVAIVVFFDRSSPDGGRPAKSSVTIHPQGLAGFMGLTKLSGGQSPNFSLEDQRGRSTTLASFRGRVVVLSFVDDRCGALCPTLDSEIVDAWHDLGTRARDVIFLGVNVNAAHDTVADLANYSARFGLDKIPSWRFVTGAPSLLSKVWKNYDVTVYAASHGGPVAYSADIYFIGLTDDEVYQVTPFANELPNGHGALPSASVQRFARGIADYATDLLP
jgi:cytochrome oxidase Cu insertion factor (SCO1/SenC/PrrC family)